MTEEKHCGECRYFGMKAGLINDAYDFHICEKQKSIYKEALATATACQEFKKKEESKCYIQ